MTNGQSSFQNCDCRHLEVPHLCSEKKDKLEKKTKLVIHLYVSICHDEVDNIDYLYGWLGCPRLFLISHMHLKVSLVCTHHSFYFTSIIYNLSHTIVPNAFMFPTPYSGATDALLFISILCTWYGAY